MATMESTPARIMSRQCLSPVRSHSAIQLPARANQSGPMRRRTAGSPGSLRLGLAHGIEVRDGRGAYSADLVHDVAGALVGGEVIEGTPVGGLADARFLGAVAPLDDVVARAEPAHGAEVVGVGLAGVARVGFGETEEIGAAAAQIAVPHPERRAEFGVVPGVAAPVVVPDVARRGVGVHEVADTARSRTRHGRRPGAGSRRARSRGRPRWIS